MKEEIVNHYIAKNQDQLSDDELKELEVKIKMILNDIEYKIFRGIVVKEHIRADGRKMDEIRPLSTSIDLLPRTHGSALFTRGETPKPFSNNSRRFRRTSNSRWIRFRRSKKIYATLQLSTV